MLLHLWTVSALLAVVSASPVRNGLYPLDVVDKLEEATMPKVQAWLSSKKNTTCTLENAAVRREWYVDQKTP
jgi:hypothetical protein